MKKNIILLFVFIAYAFLGNRILERTDSIQIQYFGKMIWYFFLGVLLRVDTVNWKSIRINRVRIVTFVLPLFIFIAYIYGDFSLAIATDGQFSLPFPMPTALLILRSSAIAQNILLIALGNFIVSSIFTDKN